MTKKAKKLDKYSDLQSQLAKELPINMASNITIQIRIKRNLGLD